MGTVGATTVPTLAGSAQPAVTGNTAALSNPALQAANLAQQKKQRDEQKRAIQAQIAALQKQLSDLNRTA